MNRSVADAMSEVDSNWRQRAEPMQPVTGTTTIKLQEFTLALRDGARMFCRAWLPNTPTNKSLILIHRGHEHSGRWQETVQALGLHDFAIFAYDARGHGHSDGERGGAPDFSAL